MKKIKKPSYTKKEAKVIRDLIQKIFLVISPFVLLLFMLYYYDNEKAQLTAIVIYISLFALIIKQTEEWYIDYVNKVNNF